MKFLRTAWTHGLSGLALAALSGCTAPLGHWDAQMGDSVRALRNAQLVDPQAAARNGDRLAAHDGKAGVQSADRYVNTFKEPPPQNIFVVGPASTGGGGGN